MLENREPIPEEFKSLEDIQSFWDKHSSADYWDEMEDVRMQLSPALASKLELNKLYRLLGLSEQQISDIEFRAKSGNMDGRQLIFRWVSEHV